MQWRITGNNIEPDRFPITTNDAAYPMPFKFCVFDADGGLYLTGEADEMDFAPLDWATAEYGATTIKFWNPHSTNWEKL